MSISVTWNLFATAVLSILAVYYAVVLLIFYRSEIAQWIRSRTTTRPSDAKLPDIGRGPSIMGRARVDQAVVPTQAEAHELVIAPDEPETEVKQNITNNEEMLIGSVADLLQEAKILMESIAEDRTGKSESKELFNALFLRYPHLQNTTYSQAICLYICEVARDKIQWDISHQEVFTWWNNNGNF